MCVEVSCTRSADSYPFHVPKTKQNKTMDSFKHDIIWLQRRTQRCWHQRSAAGAWSCGVPGALGKSFNRGVILDEQPINMCHSTSVARTPWIKNVVSLATLLQKLIFVTIFHIQELALFQGSAGECFHFKLLHTSFVHSLVHSAKVLWKQVYVSLLT